MKVYLVTFTIDVENSIMDSAILSTVDKAIDYATDLVLEYTHNKDLNVDDIKTIFDKTHDNYHVVYHVSDYDRVTIHTHILDEV